MRADRLLLVRREVVVPLPEVLLPHVIGYIDRYGGARNICAEGACIRHPSANGGNWKDRVDHHDGCPAAWFTAYAAKGEHPFTTAKAFLDALLSVLATNDSFCTHDACAGYDLDGHVEECLQPMVAAYLGWVRQDHRFIKEASPP